MFEELEQYFTTDFLEPFKTFITDALNAISNFFKDLGM